MKKWIVAVLSGLFLVGCGENLSPEETVEELYEAVWEEDFDRADELMDLDEELQPLEMDYQILREMLEESGGLDNLEIEELEMDQLETEYQHELREEITEMGYGEEATAMVLEAVEEETSARMEDDALIWLLEETEDRLVVRIINQTSLEWIEERMEENEIDD